MSDFDVPSFVLELGAFGLKLRAIRLADGSYRICRWRFHGGQPEAASALWQSQVGADQSRIDALAAYLARTTLPITAKVL